MIVVGATTSGGFEVPVGALLVFVALMTVTGFFVVVEFSLLASMRGRLEVLADERRFGARAALALSNRVGLVLAGTQLGITVAGLLLGEIAEPAVGSMIQQAMGIEVSSGVGHTIALVIALVIVVFLHTLLGEMVPKNIALARPEGSLRATGGLMTAVLWVFRPLIAWLNWLAGLGAKAFGVLPTDAQPDVATAAELSVMLAESRDEGFLDDDEHDLLTGAMEVVGRTVSTAMVPRERIVAVQRRSPATEIADVALESGLSRVLVTGRSIDDIIGFVHVKDLIALDESALPMPLPLSVFRATLHVTADQPLGEVLAVMREQRRHVAVVVGQGPDGLRATEGMVTLEDVLEAIVGEIYDESDRR